MNYEARTQWHTQRAIEALTLLFADYVIESQGAYDDELRAITQKELARVDKHLRHVNSTVAHDPQAVEIDPLVVEALELNRREPHSTLEVPPGVAPPPEDT